MARRWLLVHLPAGQAQVAIRIVGATGWSRKTAQRAVTCSSATRAVLEEIRTATDAAHLYRVLPQTLLCVGELLGGVILLLAFRNDPRGRAYLWFAAFLFLDGSMSLESVFSRVYPLLPILRFNHLTDALGMIGRYCAAGRLHRGFHRGSSQPLDARLSDSAVGHSGADWLPLSE